jgi:hypothetical protein
MQLHLKKFDVSNIRDDSVVVLVGRRGCGKSVCVRDILKYHRDIPVGTVISSTEPANKFFSKMVPPIFIHEEFNPSLIENVLKRQRMIMKRQEKEVAMYGSSDIDPRAFLIMDDVLHDSSWQKDKGIKFVFTAGRHVKLFLIIAMQYVLGIPPSLRTNVDYIFILRENILSNRKRIYEAFCGMFPTFEAFVQVMDQCTENYECLVIDQTTKSNKLEDMVYWYRADIHPDFKVGAPEFWELSEQTYVSDNDDDDDFEMMYDPKKLTKRKGPPISVKKVVTDA